MRIQLSYSATGSLLIELADPCPECKHTHPNAEHWNHIIASTSSWLAKNNPICRSLSSPGIVPWTRDDAPAPQAPGQRLSMWGTEMGEPGTSAGVAALGTAVPARPVVNVAQVGNSVNSVGAPAGPSSSIVPSPVVGTGPGGVSMPAGQAPNAPMQSPAATQSGVTIIRRNPLTTPVQHHSVSTGTPVIVAAPSMSSLVMRTPKPIRSVFGCTTCKKRKVKCDEERPRCGNCSKKSARECVYLYDVAPWGVREEVPPPPAPPLPTGTVVPSGAAVPLPFPPPPAPGPSRLRAPGQPGGAVGPLTLPGYPGLRPGASTSAAAHGAPVAPPQSIMSSTPGSSSSTSAPTSIPSVSAQSSSSAGVTPATMFVPKLETDIDQLSLYGRPSSPPPTSGLSPPLKSMLAMSSIPGPAGQTARDALTRIIEQHCMTWFIEASEAIVQEKFSSQRKRTYNERRQAVLTYCWDTYLEYQGKLPLELDDRQDLNYLANAALLYSFVAVGAMHYAYWSKFRKMPSEEHYVGAFALGRLALDALVRLVHFEPMSEWYPDREIVVKLFIGLSLYVTFAATAADKATADGMRLLTTLGKRYGTMEALIKHLDEEEMTMASTAEIIGGIVVDMAQALLRGTDTTVAPSHTFDWLKRHAIAQRVIPEAFGYSLPMASVAFETISVLYGRFASDKDSPALRTLHRTLSTDSLVAVFSSPQPPRVQTGDLLIRQSLFLLVYIDGLCLPPDHRDVVKASDTILELFSEALCNGMYTVRWLLPIIVGSSLCRTERRQAVLDIYDSMSATCGCDDISVARRLTQEVWARRDAGRPDWNWRCVMRDTSDLDIVYI